MAIAHFEQVADGLRQFERKELDRLLALVRQTREREGVVWLCGNGGSFLAAQHIALDLAKFAHVDARALGSNPGLLTATANDHFSGYEYVFAMELITWAAETDLLICLSCSGTSSSIVAAVSAAHELGIKSILLTGTVNNEVARADHIMRVWSQDYQVIEDCHMAIGHWLAKALR